MINYNVSVLVPVYGVEKYIERCARSLFEQTYQNLEFLFIDDASKDNSIQIVQNLIKDYPNRQSQLKIINRVYSQRKEMNEKIVEEQRELKRQREEKRKIRSVAYTSFQYA